MENWHRLLKIAQKKVDVKRLALAELQNKADDLQSQIDHITVQREMERLKLDNQSFSSTTLEGYLEASSQKIGGLQRDIQELEPQIEDAREALQEEYKEMKIIEITLTKKLQELKEQEAKREQQRLDEVASNLSQRQ